MGPFSATFPILVLFFISAATTAAPDFNRDCRITWGDGRAKIVEGGRGLTLSLDQNSGSGFESRNEYMFGRFDMQLKLAPGNSAGTVTTFFVSVYSYIYAFMDALTSQMIGFLFCSISCPLKVLSTTKLILSSSGTLQASRTLSTPTCLHWARETRSSSSICGSILLRLSIPIPSSGTLSGSCKITTNIHL